MAKGKREAPRPKMPKRKKVLITLCIVLLCVIGLYLFLVYTTNPFITKWRTLYIETAMTTMSHKWLATAFIPHSVVQQVVDHSAELAAQQQELVSSWDVADNAGTSTIDLNPVDPAGEEDDLRSDSEQKSEQAEVREPQTETDPTVPERDPEAEMREQFYTTYSELDAVVFEQFLAEHPGYYEDGYGGIFIEDLSCEYGLKTIYDEEVLVIDVPNNLLLLNLKSDNYVGKLAIVKNPKQVYLEPSGSLGSSAYGDTIETFSKNYDALIAINAAGFYDPDGEGWGGYIVGSYVAHGRDYTISVMPGYKTFGFKKDYRLYIENESFDKSEYLWAMQFSPALIVDGALTVEGSNGYGLQPRSAIGQTADGAFLLLTIDGRQVGYSIGATVEDCARILLQHGAYQAINLDGGSSTIMSYRGQQITKPSSVTSFGRYFPNAFIVHKADDIPES